MITQANAVIDLKEYKKSLGSLVDKLSESEILKLREQQDEEAEIYFSMWLDGIRDKENYKENEKH